MRSKKMTTIESIAQDVLARLAEDRRQQAKIAARVRQVRAEILTHLDAGAAVEPGPYELIVEARTRKLITRATLAAVLSQEEVESLWSELPEKLTRYVLVEPSFTNHGLADRPVTNYGRMFRNRAD
jgi:hypothetical protein